MKYTAIVSKYKRVFLIAAGGTGLVLLLLCPPQASAGLLLICSFLSYCRYIVRRTTGKVEITGDTKQRPFWKAGLQGITIFIISAIAALLTVVLAFIAGVAAFYLQPLIAVCLVFGFIYATAWFLTPE